MQWQTVARELEHRSVWALNYGTRVHRQLWAHLKLKVTCLVGNSRGQVRMMDTTDSKMASHFSTVRRRQQHMLNGLFAVKQERARNMKYPIGIVND